MEVLRGLKGMCVRLIKGDLRSAGDGLGFCPVGLGEEYSEYYGECDVFEGEYGIG